MMRYTAAELLCRQEINDEYEYRCPICFEVHRFDEESEDGYVDYDGEYYHYKCIEDLAKSLDLDVDETDIEELIERGQDAELC